MAQGRMKMKKLVLITDAWYPQTNGVVTTLARVSELIAKRGIKTVVIHPGLFRSTPMPGYSEIRLAVDLWHFGRIFREQQADYVHIATEGPLGMVARRWLVRQRLAFTTSLHTRFPEYVNKRLPFVPVNLGYRFLRWFHKYSANVLVTTSSLERELLSRGFDNLRVWGRGVDLDTYTPTARTEHDYQEPLQLYVGRVAVEKNLRAFLDLRNYGKKVVVGDGPSLNQLRREYPEVLFTGYKYGQDLAEWYARADVFVFPSLTDTFGLVMLEAMACGTPVAAFPVTGPVDVVKEGVTGALDDDLSEAVKRALRIPRENCRAFALEHSWQHCADIFAESLVSSESGQAAELDFSYPETVPARSERPVDEAEQSETASRESSDPSR